MMQSLWEDPRATFEKGWINRNFYIWKNKGNLENAFERLPKHGNEILTRVFEIKSWDRGKKKTCGKY